MWIILLVSFALTLSLCPTTEQHDVGPFNYMNSWPHPIHVNHPIKAVPVPVPCPYGVCPPTADWNTGVVAYNSFGTPIFAKQHPIPLVPFPLHKESPFPTTTTTNAPTFSSKLSQPTTISTTEVITKTSNLRTTNFNTHRDMDHSGHGNELPTAASQAHQKLTTPIPATTTKIQPKPYPPRVTEIHVNNTTEEKNFSRFLHIYIVSNGSIDSHSSIGGNGSSGSGGHISNNHQNIYIEFNNGPASGAPQSVNTGKSEWKVPASTIEENVRPNIKPQVHNFSSGHGGFNVQKPSLANLPRIPPQNKVFVPHQSAYPYDRHHSFGHGAPKAIPNPAFHPSHERGHTLMSGIPKQAFIPHHHGHGNGFPHGFARQAPHPGHRGFPDGSQQRWFRRRAAE